LLRDHVGRQLRPESRHLDVALLEGDLSGARGDHRVPQLPLDLVVRAYARLREAAREAHPLAGARRRGRCAVLLAGKLDRAVILCWSRLALEHRWRPPDTGVPRRPVGERPWGYFSSGREAASHPSAPSASRPILYCDSRVGKDVSSAICTKYRDTK